MKKRIWVPVVLALSLAVMGFAGFVGFEALKTVRAAVSQPAEVTAIMAHGGGGVTEEALAEALGISVDKLNTAQAAAWSAAIDQALADGSITQEQADSLKERANQGMGLGRGRGLVFGLEGIDYNSLLAKELGVTVDELNAAHQQAREAAIDEAVTAGDLTQEQADLMKGRMALSQDSGFQTSIRAAFTAAVEQAVQSGVITQAQADAILNNLDTEEPGFFGRGGMKGSFGPGMLEGIDGFQGERGLRRGRMSGSGSETPPIIE